MTTLYKTVAGEQAVMRVYQSLLSRWRVPYTTQTVKTRYGDTYVIISGAATGSALVLLHGAGSNATLWADDVAEYSQFYRIFAVDIIGEAGKSAPTRPSWDSAAYAEWLADVLDGLKLGSVSIIGLSQGAWVALKFAITYPQRVKALVLLTPGGIVPDKVTFVLQALPLMMLGTWGMRRLNRLIMANQTMPSELETALITIMQHFKPRFGKLTLFSDSELQRLTMPVQLIVGQRDVLRDGAKISARLIALLHHYDEVLIPDGGHGLVGTYRYTLPFLAQREHN